MDKSWRKLLSFTHLPGFFQNLIDKIRIIGNTALSDLVCSIWASQVTRGLSDRQHKPLTFLSQNHKANHLLTHPILDFSELVNWLAWHHVVFPRLTKLFLRRLYQTLILTFLMSKFAFKRSVAYCQCCQAKSMPMSNLVMLPMSWFLWGGMFLSLS